MELFIIWLVCAVVTGIIAKSKNRSPFLWAMAAFFLTPVVLLVILCIGDTGNQCGDCKTICPKEAVKCRACGNILTFKVEPVKNVARKCSKCGRTYDSTWNVCLFCGRSSLIDIKGDVEVLVMSNR